MKDNHFDTEQWLGGVLQQVSGQMKSTLGNMYSALERLAPPEKRDEDPQLDLDAATICRSYYRAMRLAANLTAAGELIGPGCAQLYNDDIIGLCREIMERVEEPARILELELEFRCDKDAYIIAMDARRLERMLLNLLSNSFKYTPRGGKVILEVSVGPRMVELRLSDTGCGIPEDRMEHVFEGYRQTEQMASPPHGLGLGLPICRRIAQEHGGSILISSREGEGTTVAVSLPNKKGENRSLNTFTIDYTGGFNVTLMELADALPKQAFVQKYLD